jgi:hypothetical protein
MPSDHIHIARPRTMLHLFMAIISLGILAITGTDTTGPGTPAITGTDTTGLDTPVTIGEEDTVTVEVMGARGKEERSMNFILLFVFYSNSR